MEILFINDLFNINLNLITYFQSSPNMKFNSLNWLDYSYDNTSSNLDYFVEIILNKINEINNQIIVIIDSFSLFVFIEAYKQLDKAKINKIIVLNPFTKTFKLKLLNIKNLLTPSNTKQMVYKQMYFHHQFSFFRQNQDLIDISHECLEFIYNNDFVINRLFNSIFLIKKINETIDFVFNNPNIITLSGEYNPLYSKRDVTKIAKRNNSYIIKDSGINFFNENFNQAIKILNTCLN